MIKLYTQNIKRDKYSNDFCNFLRCDSVECWILGEKEIITVVAFHLINVCIEWVFYQIDFIWLGEFWNLCRIENLCEKYN